MNMYIENEFQYETTMDQIIDNLEQLIANILLASVKRLSGDYEETVLKMNKRKEDEEQF